MTLDANRMMAVRHRMGLLSSWLNSLIERVVIIIMAALVLDVWIGVLDRYIFHWQFNWPELLARYLMIWAALLAISIGIHRREHIGLTFVIDRLPSRVRQTILILGDFLALLLFSWVLIYGIQFAITGTSRVALIFGMSMAPAFAAVPVAAGLAALQLFLTMVRDWGAFEVSNQAGEY